MLIQAEDVITLRSGKKLKVRTPSWQDIWKVIEEGFLPAHGARFYLRLSQECVLSPKNFDSWELGHDDRLSFLRQFGDLCKVAKEEMWKLFEEQVAAFLGDEPEPKGPLQ